MSWRRFFLRARWDRERSAELESYLQIETDDNIARGMSAPEARRAAHRKLGNTLGIREEIYRMNSLGFVDSLARDLRYATRGMRRRLTFTIAAVLTLALGIGANTAIFTVVYGVLIKPLSYPNSDQLVSLKHTASGLNSGTLSMSPSMYFTYRDESRVFQNVGIWTTGGQTITGLGEPEQARVAFVTYDVLHALGVQPMLGRWFSQADETPPTSGPDPVIATYGYWQRRLGGNEAALGRSLTIDARPSQIVGVMPASFRFPNFDPELILVQRFDRSRLFLGTFGVQGLARLKPGLTLRDAETDLHRLLPIWMNAWPAPPGAGREVVENWKIAPVVQTLKNEIVGNVANMLWVLMGTIGIVLLIACANIANLMLVSSDGRRHEFAIRAALGAGRGKIARELLVESLVLGVLGGVLGLTLAYVGLKVLVTSGPTNLPRLQEISVDPLVLAFALVASITSGLLFGSIPAIKHSSQIGKHLSIGARGASASRERHRTRNALVVVQVALALVLLVSSGLMVRTFQALLRVDPGFVQAEEIQTARIWFPVQIREPERFTQMQHDILDKISTISGVTSAAIVSSVPMDGRINWDAVFAEDRTYPPGETPPVRRFKYVSPGYFHSMGTRMIAGRDITWTDIDGRRNVAIISENVARELWGEPAAAIGKRIREPGPAWREVVGVVQDVHEDGLHQKSPPIVYWPIMMEKFYGSPIYGTRAIAFVIRSERAGNANLLNEVRQAVWSVNPNLPVFLINTMKELNDRSMAQTSFALVMLAIAGAMALGLGIVGIYGVISYVVSQRSREIGIRLALGAEPDKLKRMFVRHGLMLAGVGVAIGLVAAIGLAQLMSSLLFGIGPLDPATYVAVFGVLLTAAALASYMPARRAARVDPVETLKAE
jgi:predicted permease